MQRRIRVQRAHRALAWFYGLMIVVFLLARLLWSELPGSAMLLPAGVLVALFTLHLAISRAALAARPWARIASMVVGVCLLFGFPVGTVIGVYLLANTWQPWSTPVA